MFPVFMIAVENTLRPDLVGYNSGDDNACQKASGSLEETMMVVVVVVAATFLAAGG